MTQCLPQTDMPQVKDGSYLSSLGDEPDAYVRQIIFGLSRVLEGECVCVYVRVGVCWCRMITDKL